MPSPFLAGFPEGLMQAQQFTEQQRQRQLAAQLAQMQMQQALQQQQAQAAAGRALTQLPTGGMQQLPAMGGLGGLATAPGMGPQGGGMQLPQMPSTGLDNQPSAPQPFARAPAYTPSPSGSFYGSGLSRIPRQQMELPAVGSGIGRDMTPSSSGDARLSAALSSGQPPAGFPPLQAAKAALTSEATNPLQGAFNQWINHSGQVWTQRGAPPQAVKESSQTALDASSNIDPTQWGRTSLKAAADAIDKANPDLDPAVKFMAVAQLAKLMAPDEQMMLKMMLQQNQAALKVGLAEYTAGQSEQRQTERLASRAEQEEANRTLRETLRTETEAAIDRRLGQRETFTAQQKQADRQARERIQDRIDARQQKAQEARSSLQTTQQKGRALQDLYNQAEQDIREYTRDVTADTNDLHLRQLLQQRDQLKGEMDQLAGRPGAAPASSP